MRKPFGYRSVEYAERHFGLATVCEKCSHVHRPKVRLMCSLTGSVVGKHKTCSVAMRELIGGIK